MEVNIEEEMHLDDMDVYNHDKHFNSDVQSRAAMMHNLFGSDSDNKSHSEDVYVHFQNDGCNGDDEHQGPMSNDGFQSLNLNDELQNKGSNG
ncbi:hypothetical protein ACS0TY_004237 [Phlomoides rotata]